MQLFNKLSSKENEELIDAEKSKRIILSFYKYAKIGNPELFRDYLYFNLNNLKVLGRIYIASEGINAQISVLENNFSLFKSFLNSISFLKNNRLNIAVEHYNKSFLKLKVKIRKKIVSDGLNDKKFEVTNAGEHLGAEDFNNLLLDSDSLCIDMRNHYESEVGHFTRAITPDVDTFRDSLSFVEKILSKFKKNKRIIMYCTGGIRCEKASAYFKYKGFKNVFQLEGGIIEYYNQVKEKGIESMFLGKNFVFDERRAERISADVISICHQCGKSCDKHVNCANEACHLLFIQCDSCNHNMNSCCSDNCKEIINFSIEDQKKLRRGKHNSNKIFKKGRSKILKFKQNLSKT
ncbi:MAG: rhodanese-related sulfurtransferase [Flavobacteriaceae bacterium]|nr:rhodanese-related sulfurtransferase [Flavobacteriaceae bacterium]